VKDANGEPGLLEFRAAAMILSTSHLDEHNIRATLLPFQAGNVQRREIRDISR